LRQVQAEAGTKSTLRSLKRRIYHGLGEANYLDEIDAKRWNGEPLTPEEQAIVDKLDLSWRRRWQRRRQRRHEASKL
jgi:hypothetical protein